ncbi:hypothetical protein, partial [Pseudomonas sp. PS01303]|uniref:hypothetical protein n=1 Tax=Pseudomonas sp. PS01303 TaxID=2991439 RepID=UPI00249A8BC5
SLLAMAVDQSPDALADTPQSRAGSLLQLFLGAANLIVPTLCVGMQPGALCVPKSVTQSVTGGVTTQSVGTIIAQ